MYVRDLKSHQNWKCFVCSGSIASYQLTFDRKLLDLARINLVAKRDDFDASAK